MGLSRPEIIGQLEQALRDGDGLLGAHCIHELWMRNEYPANIESSLKRLWKAAASSIPEWLPMRYVDWLPAVYEVAARCAVNAGPVRSGPPVRA